MRMKSPSSGLVTCFPQNEYLTKILAMIKIRTLTWMGDQENKSSFQVGRLHPLLLSDWRNCNAGEGPKAPMHGLYSHTWWKTCRSRQLYAIQHSLFLCPQIKLSPKKGKNIFPTPSPHYLGVHAIFTEDRNCRHSLLFWAIL